MKLLLHVDTNDYNEDLEVTDYSRISNDFVPLWSLFSLKTKTFQNWQVAGQTGFWTVDGETFCGTAYECEINYTGNDAELLLRCLIAKIKEVCKERFMRMWIEDLEVKFTDDDLVEMRPKWIKAMKG